MEVRMEILIMKHCIACTLHVLYLETYWIVPCDSQYSYSSLFFRFEIHRNAVDYVLPSGTRQDSPTISDVVVGKQNCRRQQSKGVSLPRHRRRRPVPILEQTFLFCCWIAQENTGSSHHSSSSVGSFWIKCLPTSASRHWRRLKPLAVVEAIESKSPHRRT